MHICSMNSQVHTHVFHELALTWHNTSSKIYLLNLICHHLSPFDIIFNRLPPIFHHFAPLGTNFYDMPLPANKFHHLSPSTTICHQMPAMSRQSMQNGSMNWLQSSNLSQFPWKFHYFQPDSTKFHDLPPFAKKNQQFPGSPCRTAP